LLHFQFKLSSILQSAPGFSTSRTRLNQCSGCFWKIRFTNGRGAISNSLESTYGLNRAAGGFV